MAHFPQREKATTRHRRIVCGEVLAHMQIHAKAPNGIGEHRQHQLFLRFEMLGSRVEILRWQNNVWQREPIDYGVGRGHLAFLCFR